MTVTGMMTLEPAASAEFEGLSPGGVSAVIGHGKWEPMLKSDEFYDDDDDGDYDDDDDDLGDDDLDDDYDDDDDVDDDYDDDSDDEDL